MWVVWGIRDNIESCYFLRYVSQAILDSKQAPPRAPHSLSIYLEHLSRESRVGINKHQIPYPFGLVNPSFPFPDVKRREPLHRHALSAPAGLS